MDWTPLGIASKLAGNWLGPPGHNVLLASEAPKLGYFVSIFFQSGKLEARTQLFFSNA